MSPSAAVLALVQACRASPSWQHVIWEEESFGQGWLISAVAQVLIEAGQPASVVQVELCNHPLVEGSSAHHNQPDTRYALYQCLMVGEDRFSFDKLWDSEIPTARTSEEAVVAWAQRQWGVDGGVQYVRVTENQPPGYTPADVLAETRSLGAGVLARLAQQTIDATTASSRRPGSRSSGRL